MKCLIFSSVCCCFGFLLKQKKNFEKRFCVYFIALFSRSSYNAEKEQRTTFILEQYVGLEAGHISVLFMLRNDF